MARSGPLIAFLLFACCVLLAVGVAYGAQFGLLFRAALFGVCLGALPVVAFLQRHTPPLVRRHHDRKQSPPETNRAAMTERYTYDALVVPLIATFFTSLFFWYPFSFYVYVSAVYGHVAWMSGVHITGRHWQLSNGETMSELAQLLMSFGPLVLALATLGGSYFAAAYLGMRFHRERLADQLELYRRSLRSLPDEFDPDTV